MDNDDPEVKKDEEETKAAEETTTASIIDEIVGDSEEDIKKDEPVIEDEPGEEEGEKPGGEPDDKSEDKPEEKEGDEKLEDEPDDKADEEYTTPMSDDDKEILDGLKADRSKSRFKEMNTSIHELSGERDQYKDAVESIHPMIQSIHDAGITTEQMTNWIGVQSLARTNPQAALQELDRQRESLAKFIGVEVPGVDLLADFPDLQKQVEDLDITKDAALMVANSRRMIAQNSAVNESQQQQQQQEGNYQTAVTQAQGEIVDMEGKWKKENPDYKTIEAEMGNAAESIAANFPPHMWADELNSRYEQLVRMARALGTEAKPNPPVLRPSGSHGGKASGTESTLDIIDRIANGG